MVYAIALKTLKLARIFLWPNGMSVLPQWVKNREDVWREGTLTYLGSAVHGNMNLACSAHVAIFHEGIKILLHAYGFQTVNFITLGHYLLQGLTIILFHMRDSEHAC